MLFTCPGLIENGFEFTKNPYCRCMRSSDYGIMQLFSLKIKKSGRNETWLFVFQWRTFFRFENVRH